MREAEFSQRRTLLVTVVIATVCALLVTGASTLLKPRQLAWLAIEQNRSIVAAMFPALVANDLDAGQVVELISQLDVQLIDLATGEESGAANPLTFDFFGAASRAEFRYEIPAQLDLAGLSSRSSVAPVYLFLEDDRIQRVGLPIYGQGMWSTINGYIVVEADFNTIANIQFYQHGETPGIGDQIETAEWRRLWAGKKINDAAGKFRLSQKKGTTAESDLYEIDAISGATVTSSAVISTAQYWLGADGYATYLGKLSREANR